MGPGHRGPAAPLLSPEGSLGRGWGPRGGRGCAGRQPDKAWPLRLPGLRNRGNGNGREALQPLQSSGEEGAWERARAGQQEEGLGSNLDSLSNPGWVTLGKCPPSSLDLSFPICPHEGPTRAGADRGEAAYVPWLRGQLPLTSSCSLVRMWTWCY